jgi:hypothetical protein
MIKLIKILVIFTFFSLSSDLCVSQSSPNSTRSQSVITLNLTLDSRLTLIQQLANSFGGTGPVMGVQYNYWRLGIGVKYGINFMQTPKPENLIYNRLRTIGGEFELKLGRKQSWICNFGMTNHRYHIRSKESEVTNGIIIKSIYYKVDQNAKDIGLGRQFTPYFRLLIHYEWERNKFTDIDNYGHPSSAYLIIRGTFTLNPKGINEEKNSKE